MKGLRPIVKSINSVKDIFCVDQCSVQPVTYVHTVALNLPVGARLQFLGNMAVLGASPKVKRILKEGYILPFQNRPALTMSSIIISGYVGSLRNSYLMKATHLRMQKQVVKKVKNQTWLFSTEFSWFENPTS